LATGLQATYRWIQQQYAARQQGQAVVH
jgi:hypothetical protein